MRLHHFLLPIALTATAGAQSLNIVAHEDDDLLFFSPIVLHEVQTGLSVRTIFLTAGDAGQGADYWMSRQEGSKAAYAQMSGVANSWTQSDPGIPGFDIPMFTLDQNPGISLVFLQLPDGNQGGEGFGSGSLQQLWQGDRDTLTSKSGSSYTKDDLINVLRQLGDKLGYSHINTQDFVNGYGDGDHSDHHTTGYFVREAFGDCWSDASITAYMGYPVTSQPANINAASLATKKAVFYTYGGYDRNTCHSDQTCSGRQEALWLEREYYVGELDQSNCRTAATKASVASTKAAVSTKAAIPTKAAVSTKVVPSASPTHSRKVINKAAASMAASPSAAFQSGNPYVRFTGDSTRGMVVSGVLCVFVAILSAGALL
jgi:LmbE family N-acetylglucosaminyl deacetylase